MTLLAVGRNFVDFVKWGRIHRGDAMERIGICFQWILAAIDRLYSLAVERLNQFDMVGADKLSDRIMVFTDQGEPPRSRERSLPGPCHWSLQGPGEGGYRGLSNLVPLRLDIRCLRIYALSAFGDVPVDRAADVIERPRFISRTAVSRTESFWSLFFFSAGLDLSRAVLRVFEDKDFGLRLMLLDRVFRAAVAFVLRGLIFLRDFRFTFEMRRDIVCDPRVDRCRRHYRIATC